jgi:hypothetical protein
MRRLIIWNKFAGILEEHTSSIDRGEEYGKKVANKKKSASRRRWNSTRLHALTLIR